MGVNTEMHDCEPAMTRPQHLNMSYSLFQLHPRADYQTLWAPGIKHPFAPSPPPPPPSFLISAQWMTLALLTMRGLIF